MSRRRDSDNRRVGPTIGELGSASRTRLADLERFWEDFVVID